MKAILHIGVEKTGSTTIQSFLERNRRCLGRRGLEIFPSVEGVATRAMAAYAMDEERFDDFVVGHSITGLEERRAWRAEFEERFREAVSRVPDGTEAVLFSSEHFHSRLRRHEDVRMLRSLLDPYFDRFEIIVYLRRQDEVSRSLYSTALRAGHAPDGLLVGKPQGPYYDYESLVKRWSETFGREAMRIRRFERTWFVGGDLVEDFVATLGLPWSKSYVPAEAENEALSATVQRAIRELNMHFPRLRGDRTDEFHRRMRNYCVDYLSRRCPGKPLLPSRGEAMEFYSFQAERNRKLAMDFLGEVMLFEEDFGKYPEVGAGVEPGNEAIALLLSALHDFERKERTRDCISSVKRWTARGMAKVRRLLS